MKKRTISFLCGLLVAACSPELYDENSVLENNRQQAEMSVEVQVSGTMVSTRTVASDDERAVTSYDIYIFDVTANALQYYKQGIVPIEPEKIAGTHGCHDPRARGGAPQADRLGCRRRRAHARRHRPNPTPDVRSNPYWPVLEHHRFQTSSAYEVPLLVSRYPHHRSRCAPP